MTCHIIKNANKIIMCNFLVNYNLNDLSVQTGWQCCNNLNLNVKNKTDQDNFSFFRNLFLLCPYPLIKRVLLLCEAESENHTIIQYYRKKRLWKLKHYLPVCLVMDHQCGFSRPTWIFHFFPAVANEPSYNSCNFEILSLNSEIEIPLF